jgi:hypothetical protein
MRRLGEDRGPPAALADRALPVPHQHPRHRPKLADELPPAGEQVLGHPRRNEPGRQPAGIAGHHHQHRQPRRRPGLAEPHRQRDRREPQVTLGHLAGGIGGPRGRVGWQVHRPEVPDAVLEHRQPAGPADPLGDHRGRHRRPRLKQLPDPRLDRVHHRARSHPLVARRPCRGQRPLHRVLRDPHHPRDLGDRHPLRAVQPADLRPVSTLNTPLPPQLDSSQGPARVNFQPSVGGQFSPVADRRPAHSLLTDGAHTAGRPSTRLWQTVQVRRTEVDGSVRHGTSWWGSNPGALPAPDSGSEHRINSIISVPCAAIR